MISNAKKVFSWYNAKNLAARLYFFKLFSCNSFFMAFKKIVPTRKKMRWEKIDFAICEYIKKTFTLYQKTFLWVCSRLVKQKLFE